jgi:hypothetical protein
MNLRILLRGTSVRLPRIAPYRPSTEVRRTEVVYTILRNPRRVLPNRLALVLRTHEGANTTIYTIR